VTSGDDILSRWPSKYYDYGSVKGGLDVDPVAFAVFGVSIRWYGILITVGMLAGIILALSEVRRRKDNENWFLDMLFFAIPAGLLGSRLYYVAFNLAEYRTLLEALNFREGGLAIHGGVLGGVLAAYAYTRYRRVNFWHWADIAAPSIILAQAIGRWGNYFNEEAYGIPTRLPWAMYIAGEYRHPAFLYESLWNLGVFAVLIFVLRRRQFVGQVASLYLVGYSLGRLWIEAIRADSLWLGPFRAAQVVSVFLIILGVYIYRRLR